jgi:hypothetical protein
VHDLTISTGDLSLAAALGVSRGWAIEALVPLRLNRERIRFRTLDGAPYEPDPPDVHHANRTLVGLADPWLLVHVGGTRGPWSAGARLGASLPVGRTEPDPFALGDAGLPHEHIQFGAGTVEPIAALGVAHDFGAWSLAARGLARFGTWTNAHGYRAGDQSLATLLASSKLGSERWTYEAGGTWVHETAETWGGAVQYEGNLGRTDLYAEAHATRTMGEGWSVGAEARVPVSSRSTGAQLDVPLTIRVNVTHGFAWRNAE